MKNINCSPLQQVSIEAAVKHFQTHDCVLCADEAGLGKTIIARGIIEKMANEKLNQGVFHCRNKLAETQGAEKYKEAKIICWNRGIPADFWLCALL